MWPWIDSKGRPRQAAYNKLEAKAQKAAATLCTSVASGRLSADAWADKFLDLLSDQHGAAATLGRQRAGVTGDRNDDDSALGAAIATGEWQFLQSFRDDIKDGRYNREDGKKDVARIRTRASWYVKKLLATANEAFVSASKGSATFTWVLGVQVESHCDECPDLAKGGPYTSETLPTYPRGGETSCLFHCSCSLKRSDGIVGFNAPNA